jgi:large subunit ribosomal protein L25
MNKNSTNNSIQCHIDDINDNLKKKHISAIIYGKNKHTLKFSIKRSDIKLDSIFINKYVHLNINNVIYESLIQDFNIHPVKRHIIHIDFVYIHKNNKIIANIPLNVINIDKLPSNCKCHVFRKNLAIKTSPENIVENITLDISNFSNFKNIYIKDILSLVPNTMQITNVLDNIVAKLK